MADPVESMFHNPNTLAGDLTIPDIGKTIRVEQHVALIGDATRKLIYRGVLVATIEHETSVDLIIDGIGTVNVPHDTNVLVTSGLG